MHHFQRSVHDPFALITASTAWRDIAIRLITESSKEGEEEDGLLLLNRMDEILSRLAGHLGSRSLIARAVTLAQVDTPWLRPVRVQPDDILQDLGDQFSAVIPQERISGETNILACLLGLLDTFIGERLTIQLIKEAIPDLDIQQVHVRKDTPS